MSDRRIGDPSYSVINSLGEKRFTHEVPLGMNKYAAAERAKKGIRVPANFASPKEKILATQALIKASFNASLAKRAEEAAAEAERLRAAQARRVAEAAAEAERLRAAFVAGLTLKKGGGGKRTVTRKHKKRANKRKTRRYHS